jgi:hypothetical protein
MLKSLSMRKMAPLAAAAGLLASCQAVPPTSLSGTVDTHQAMVSAINPAALAIWEVTNNAMGETGGLDPALMDSAAWSRLEGAARALESHSRRMGEAESLFVGAHNDETEGFATRAEIQAMIDAYPDGFRAMSRKMAEDAGALLEAASARNAQRSGDLADGLSENCGSCHSRYWEKP